MWPILIILHDRRKLWLYGRDIANFHVINKWSSLGRFQSFTTQILHTFEQVLKVAFPIAVL